MAQPLFNVNSALSCGNTPNIQLHLPNAFSSYYWDMGNGVTGTNYQPPATTYTQGGTYDISLTITSATPFRIIDSVVIMQTNTSWQDCSNGDQEADYYLEFSTISGSLLYTTPKHSNQNTPSVITINGLRAGSEMLLEVWEADNSILCLLDDALGTVTIPNNTAGGIFQNVPEGLTLKITTKMVTSFTCTRTISVSQTSALITETCADNQHFLSAPDFMASYQWSTGETTQDITVSTAGVYKVTVSQANGCTGTNTHSVTNPTPAQPQVTCASNVLVCTNYTSFLTWLDSDFNAIPFASDIAYVPTEPGIYYVKYWGGTCDAISLPISFPDCGAVATEDVLEKTAFRVYPNPSSDGQFTFELPENGRGETSQLTVLNTQGQIVHQRILTQKTVDLSDLDQGIYVVYLQSKSAQYRERIAIVGGE